MPKKDATIDKVISELVSLSFKKSSSVAYKLMNDANTYLIEISLRRVGIDDELEASMQPKSLLLNEFSNFLINFPSLSQDEVENFTKTRRFKTNMSFHIRDFHAFEFYLCNRSLNIGDASPAEFAKKCASLAELIYLEHPNLETIMADHVSDDMPLDMRIGIFLYLKKYEEARKVVEQQRYNGSISSLYPKNADLFLASMGR